jgi:hypothetical protein
MKIGAGVVLLLSASLSWMIPESAAAGPSAVTSPVSPVLDATGLFEGLVAKHRAIRAKLDKPEQETLDKLTTRCRAVLTERRLRDGLWRSALAALKASGMMLDDKERSVLATYVLDGIAARDDLVNFVPNSEAWRRAQAAQQSFNLQYLQLQSELQDQNRRYELVINIMKAKHDTVMNSISNIR